MTNLSPRRSNPFLLISSFLMSQNGYISVDLIQQLFSINLITSFIKGSFADSACTSCKVIALGIAWAITRLMDCSTPSVSPLVWYGGFLDNISAGFFVPWIYSTSKS